MRFTLLICIFNKKRLGVKWVGITISTLDCSEEIKKILLKESCLLNKNGIKFIFDEEKKKDITLFEIDLENGENVYYANKYLADIIAGVVLNNLEEKLVKKIVNHKYNKFTEEEREKIIDLTINQLKDSMRSKTQEKNIIVSKILNYLKNNQDFNLEGFVRFRLKEYMYHIHLAINQAVDDIIIEKEYEEFIDLLQYFVGLQEVKIPLVHLYKKDNGYKLLDKDGNLLENNLVKNYIKELLDEEITHEDILISSLINLSPAKIVVHFKSNELIDTLQRIFKDKIEIDLS